MLFMVEGFFDVELMMVVKCVIVLVGKWLLVDWCFGDLFEICGNLWMDVDVM